MPPLACFDRRAVAAAAAAAQHASRAAAMIAHAPQHQRLLLSHPHHQHHQHHATSSITKPTRARRAVAVAAAPPEQHQQQDSPPAARAAAAATSLVPETLEALAADSEQAALMAALKSRGQAALTREEERARRRSLQALQLPSFGSKLQDAGLPPLTRSPASILQLNIGLYCNQACSHCHVESSPARQEMMDRATADRCLALLAGSGGSVSCLDITGGAPELNSQFRYLVSRARQQQQQPEGGELEIIDRCNLTVLCEPGQEDLPQFLADHKVRVVASLPCYSADNVDAQRGRGVYERSIRGLQLLNSVGYGQPGSGLVLDLVYNPGGAFLAPPQEKLAPAYRQELQEAHGISFNSLLCLNNMPIKRFADWLLRQGRLQEYMATLVNAFNPAAVAHVMCTNTVSVAWDGALYDCDFNQQLALGITPSQQQQQQQQQQQRDQQDQQQQLGADKEGPPSRKALTVWDIDSLADLTGRRVRVGSHCYGCTAGSGSSCQGAVA